LNSYSERVESVAAILREQIPGSEVTVADPGNDEAVVFTITRNRRGEGAVIFRISSERFQEDQAETEEWVRQAVRQFAPGDSYLLTSTGELVPN
jgi:hypothetical protein